MKKILALLFTVALAITCLTACKSDVPTLSNVGGDVLSGNGTFAVVKGEYVYFVNGVATAYNDNEMGDVLKGALCRVKKNEVGVKNANVEVVIPKLVTTSSATNGVFIYGNVVYYASPYDEKDKSGTIRSDYTDFRYFNLENGDSERITYEDSSVSKYQFIQNASGSVYLAYECTETIDGAETKVLKVVGTNGSQVYSVSKYSNLLFADNNADKIYFSKAAYSESLKADEGFSEVYSYSVGKTEADLVFSGCGYNGLTRDGRGEDASYKAKIFSDEQGVYYTDFSGASVTLIKNTGKYLIMKVTGVDTNLATAYYFGLDLSKPATVANLVEMGKSNTYIDTAIKTTSYVKSLTEIYYIENTTYLKGLVKFNYETLSTVTHGRTLVTGDASGYNISTAEGNYLYLSGSSGDYYRIDLATAGAKLKKINAVALKGATEWFAPRVIDGKFIGVYSDSIYQGYLYAIDLKDIDNEDKDEDDKTLYDKYLEKYSELERDEVITLSETIVGKMTSADKDSFNTALDSTYPAKDQE
ncbi:MAG: hypothetical protein J6V66_03390 [Clostridia bacterium]|nr:hypothetical protein [Clostridia bacterium]